MVDKMGVGFRFALREWFPRLLEIHTKRHCDGKERGVLVGGGRPCVCLDRPEAAGHSIDALALVLAHHNLDHNLVARKLQVPNPLFYRPSHVHSPPRRRARVILFLCKPLLQRVVQQSLYTSSIEPTSPPKK